MALLAAISLMAWLSLASTQLSPYEYVRGPSPLLYSNYYRVSSESPKDMAYKPAVSGYGQQVIYDNDYYTNAPEVYTSPRPSYSTYSSYPSYSTYPSYTTSSPKSNIKFLSSENLMDLTKGTTHALSSVLSQFFGTFQSNGKNLFNRLQSNGKDLLSRFQSDDGKNLKTEVLKPLTKDSDDYSVAAVTYPPTAAYDTYNGYQRRR